MSFLNTVSADEASLTRGEKLYAVYCDMCHGRTGSAKEEVTRNFEVSPSPLTDEKINSYTDGGLFYLITNGVEGTKMRPFREMDEEDRWNIVNYVKALPKKRTILDSIREFVSL
ncbi:MAG: c-type cytochrome [Candidatus Hydrothermarchaeales archaeon]